MSLCGESRSERKLPRPVRPICMSRFLLERTMRLSGMVYLELIKCRKYFLGSLSLAWCNLEPVLPLWDCSLLTESELRWVLGNNRVYGVEHSSLGSLCSVWMNLELCGNIRFTLRTAIRGEAGVKQCLCSWVHYLYSDLIHKGHRLDGTCGFLGTPGFWESLGFQLLGSLYVHCVVLVQLLRFKVLSNCA